MPVKALPPKKPPRGPSLRLWLWFWLWLAVCVRWPSLLPVAAVGWPLLWYVIEMQFDDGWVQCRRCEATGRRRTLLRRRLMLCRKCKGHRQHVRLGWRIWDPLAGARSDARKAK